MVEAAGVELRPGPRYLIFLDFWKLSIRQKRQKPLV